MNVFASILEALSTLKSDDVTLTVAGKEGQGNQNVRVHYKRENLLTKVIYRHDLSKLGADHEHVQQYLSNLQLPQQSPWVKLPGKDQLQMTQLLRAASVERDMFLPASSDVADQVLAVYETLPRTHAFIRQWSAQGKGVGLELVMVFKDGETFAITECSLNFYIEPDVEKMLRRLKEAKVDSKEHPIVVVDNGQQIGSVS